MMGYGHDPIKIEEFYNLLIREDLIIRVEPFAFYLGIYNACPANDDIYLRLKEDENIYIILNKRQKFILLSERLNLKHELPCYELVELKQLSLSDFFEKANNLEILYNLDFLTNLGCDDFNLL